MKTLLIVSLIAAVLLGITGAVFAKNKGFCQGPEGKMGWMMERVGKRLDLDETQKASLGALGDKLMTIREGFVQDREQHREAIGEMLEAPQLDRALAESMFAEKQQKFAEHGQTLINAFADFSDGLRPEQRTTLVETIKDFPFGHGSRFGRSHGSM